MLNKKPTVSVYLDTRRPKLDNTYPVKLRITYKRRRKYYGIGDYSMTEASFKSVMGEKPRGEFKELRQKFNILESKATETINLLPSFTFDKFEKKFFSKTGAHPDLFSAFEIQINSLDKNGQAGTSSTYRTAYNSIKKFTNNRSRLDFDEVTAIFLYNYERWMKNTGKSPTTISINTRCIRRLFNIAIYEGVINSMLYPFGNIEKGMYSPPQANNFKKALPKTDIKKIFEYAPEEGSVEHFSRDIWIFSYLCNGINMADIFRLKYSNLLDGEIIFIRQKTSHKRRLNPIIAPLRKETEAIIRKWGTYPRQDSNYIFGILKYGLTPVEELAKIKQATKQVNKYMKRIAKMLGITESISTYTARHSFATILKLEGENVSFISEALGHSNVSVTENYLSGFDRKKREEAASKLTDWG